MDIAPTQMFDKKCIMINIKFFAKKFFLTKSPLKSGQNSCQQTQNAPEDFLIPIFPATCPNILKIKLLFAKVKNINKRRSKQQLQNSSAEYQ